MRTANTIGNAHVTKSERGSEQLHLSQFFGWGSAKATGNIHAVLEVLEILCLVLVVGFDFDSSTVAANWCLAALVVSETLRFAYGHRSDRLSEIEHNRTKEELRGVMGTAKEIAFLMAYRSLGDMDAFQEAMREFSGTRYAMEMLSIGGVMSQEVGELQWRLNIGLKNAGWIAEGYPRARPHLNFGVFVATITGGRDNVRRSRAGDALCALLDANDTAALMGVISEEYLASQGVAVLIQVGPKPETIEQYQQIKKAYRQKLDQAQP